MADRCTHCGQLAMSERAAPFSIAHGGKTLTIDDVHSHCASCGRVSYVGDQISKHELAVAAAVRQAEGLLSAEELRRVRAKYRLKQTDLEQMFSVGPKTWTRWERGKVPQSKAADTLIRLIADDPDVARRLMLQAGVQNAEAEAVFSKFDEDTKRVASALLRKELGTALGEAELGRLADRAVDTLREGRRQVLAQAEAA